MFHLCTAPHEILTKTHQKLQQYRLPSNVSFLTIFSIMPYSYEALDKTKKLMRLVTLLPGPRSSKINCTIKVVDLKDKPQYEALSYEWGPLENLGEILVNNEPLPVRSNLLHALLDIRLAKASKIIWIDAICIDQANIAERNSQVEMMGDIYRNAATVRAWLGPGSDISSDAFKLLQRFKKARSGADNSKRAHKLSNHEKALLFAFTELSYWKRIWIVQELVLAQEIIFHCGEEDVAWWPLLLMSLRLTGFLHSPAGLIMSLRDRRRKNSLLVLMRNCYASEATDTRDRVYALLGIAADVSPNTISVDYSITLYDLKKQIEELYREQELLAAPLLWQAIGSSKTSDDTYDMELGFSRYLHAYFHRPGVFRQIEETRTLAVSTSYNTNAVKDKLRHLVLELEKFEKSSVERVDSGIAVDDAAS